MRKARVIVDRLREGGKIGPQIYDASKVIGLEEEAKSSRAIFIKPNLTYPVYKKGVTTRFEFVRDLVGVLVGINPNLKIYVGEGEGGYNSFSMSDALRDMGFNELENEFRQVKIVNLSKIPARGVVIDTPKGPYNVELPGIFFDEIDFSISCPVPKVHAMTKITLSYKNQWGCLPDVMRLKNHFMFDYIIPKIADVLKFKYAFLDGKYGLTDNGPMIGDPIEVNWFAAADSLGAFDRVISGMMGFDWRKIRHLNMAGKYGFVPNEEEIEITGDPKALGRKFVLRRIFWNYPALLAFHSRSLTELVYFSRWAKLLHDVMYTFRKRPINSEE